MTMQRRVILEELAKVTSHPTADQLYQLVRRQLPRISLGTVYRNLDILSQTGMILRLDGEGQRRFDANANNHYHICCTLCGRTDDLQMKLIPKLEQNAAKAGGYQVTGHQLEFQGICPACLAKADSQAE